MADDKEKKAFEELKKRMEGSMESEMYEDNNLFYRFLMARDFKVDQAELMLREHLVWREKYDIKNISQFEPPEVLKEYFYLPKLGHDKEGRIVRYVPSGNIDCKGILASCELEDWKKYVISFFEDDIIELRKQSEKLGKLVDKVVYIHNLEHFSLSKATDKKVLYSLNVFKDLYADNYPERLHCAYVINAPTYFSIFFSIFKRFLPSRVIQKVKVYSDESWRKDLLDAIDAEELPIFLNGKKTDPDGNPECNTYKGLSGEVPEKYYIKKSKLSSTNLPDARKMTISRSSFQDIFTEVAESGSYLEWEFELKSGDIEFGLFYRDNQQNKTELIPPQRINTDECSARGAYKCDKVGTYILQFNNTYSYLRSKEVCYTIKIRSPEKGVPDFINNDAAYCSSIEIQR